MLRASRLTIRSRAAVGGCECSQAILLGCYATTWPRAELSSREPRPGSIVVDHRLRHRFLLQKGSLTVKKPQARNSAYREPRVVVSRSRGSTRLDCSVVPLAEKSGAPQRAGSSASHIFLSSSAKALTRIRLTLVDASEVARKAPLRTSSELPRSQANWYSRCRVHLETARARDSQRSLAAVKRQTTCSTTTSPTRTSAPRRSRPCLGGAARRTARRSTTSSPRSGP